MRRARYGTFARRTFDAFQHESEQEPDAWADFRGKYNMDALNAFHRMKNATTELRQIAEKLHDRVNGSPDKIDPDAEKKRAVEAWAKYSAALETLAKLASEKPIQTEDNR